MQRARNDAGFNKMPVQKAKNKSLKINGLQSQCRMLKNCLGNFLRGFFVHNFAAPAACQGLFSMSFLYFPPRT
jgi:hypothetical protein